MTAKPAIEIHSLCKEYVLGGAESQEDSFREMIVGAIAAPFKKLKHLTGEVDAKNRIWALKDVSFEVQKGEVIGIIGRNGAGKSTLLKILSRITEPTEGRVITRGRVASLLEVGTGFHPELTGRENIFLNGAILGMKQEEIQRKFDEIVAFAETERFLDTPVKRYSSGMYVRLAFAVAASLESEILIVDEVLAVGDLEFQKKCLNKMRDASMGGRTVLLVSHNMNAIQMLTSRCVVLNKGTVSYFGKTERALEEYYLSSTSTELVFNLESGAYRVRTYSGMASFDRISFLPANGRSFYFDENVAMEICFHQLETLGSVCFGLTMHSISGSAIGSGFSEPINAAEVGSIKIKLSLPSKLLAPGRYFISISLFSGTSQSARTNHDIVHEIGPIDILPSPKRLENAINWNRGYGDIVISPITVTNMSEL